MGTRFVTTEECDASPESKQAYLDASEGQIEIIDSPVGMPGRAIFNKFIQRVREMELHNPSHVLSIALRPVISLRVLTVSCLLCTMHLKETWKMDMHFVVQTPIVLKSFRQ